MTLNFRKTQMTQFEGIVPALAAALEKRGYTELTPVQIAMIAPDLIGADALVSAQTGSGKTVAFGLALAPTLLGAADRFTYTPAPLALIVAPTRELALQVQRELAWLFETTGANIASCVGGMDYRTEKRALERGAHIVVGTPGRLRDHIERHSLDLSGLRAVVLDEADEMLDLGFREDLEFILDASPKDRRTLMFSATVSRPIAQLAQNYQRDAVRVATAGERKQHVDIEYRALSVATADRENAIINLLRFYEAQTALVFCSTRAAVNHLMARFNNRGFSVVALSGELSQNERTHALQAMRDGRARVCIATDVAARGIDLPGLELVIHADLPGNRETLLHRSGRTGRAGNKGVSALIVAPGDRKKAERLLAAAAINATWARPPSADEVNDRDIDRLLGSETLNLPVAEDEASLVGRMLADHAPDQIAAAFVRLWRAGRSAPEELRDAAEPAKRDRQEFGESIWIALSVGRSQNAEPRWLLPMLCGAGAITKTEIGAIRMLDDETHVQLAASCADGFFAAVGPDMTLEKGITLRLMDRAPEGARPSHSAAPVGKPQYRKSYDSDASPARAFVQKPRPFEDRQKPAYVPKPPREFDAAPHVAPVAVVEPASAAAKPAYVPKPRPVEAAAMPDLKPSWRPRDESADPARPKHDPDSAPPRAPYKARETTRDGAPNRKFGDKPAHAKSPGAKPAYSKSAGAKPGAAKPVYGKPSYDRPAYDKPAYDTPRGEDRGPAKPPYRPRDAEATDGATRRIYGDKPAGGKPTYSKPAFAKSGAAKPSVDKPYGKPKFDPTDPSASKRKPGTKPAFKAGAKPGPRAAGPKPEGKSFSRSASDMPKRPKPKS